MNIFIKHPAGFSLHIRRKKFSSSYVTIKRNGMGRETKLGTFNTIQTAVNHLRKDFDLGNNIEAKISF